MTGQIVGQIILWLIVIAIVIAIGVWLLQWLYHRSTKHTSFVRTGFGGERVVINGGAFVLPIVHEVTPVSLNVHRLPVVREKNKALITHDRMRVDIAADFYVRVEPSASGVSAAATTLGDRMQNTEGLADLLEGKFVSILRSVASEMSLDEMHEKRGVYLDQVADHARSVLAENGLILESAAITDLDQTELEYFNPANRFDAEGLTTLVGTIEERRKHRNDIEQSAILEIRARNLQAEQQALEIDRQSTSAKLAQEQEIKALQAAQATEIARVQASQSADAEAARIAAERATATLEIARKRDIDEEEITAREEIERRRISQERSLELARIDQKKRVQESEIAENAAIEAAKLESEKALHSKRIETEEATQAREIERSQAIESATISSQKALESARIDQELTLERARIDREKILKTVRISEQQATKEAEIAAHEEIERARIATDRSLEEARIILERDTRRLEVERSQAIELAEIEKEMAILQKRAEENMQRSSTAEAEAKAVIAAEEIETGRETEIARRVAVIDKLIAEKDADTARVATETERLRATVQAEAQRLLNEAENMLTDDARSGRLRSEMLERLEGIIRESVRPLENIDGIKIVQMGGVGPSDQPSGKSPTDEVIDSALRYRAQAPLIDEMMKEIGVPDAGVAKMGDVFRTAKDIQSLSDDDKNNSEDD